MLNLARTLLLVIATIIVTLFFVFLIHNSRFELLDILSYAVGICSSALLIYFLIHVFLKSKIDDLLETIRKSIDDIIFLTRNDIKKDKVSIENSFASIKSSIKAVIFLLLISSGSFLIFAILTNTILISNLAVNLAYNNKLEEQNYLSKENNIAQYADKIEYLNEQIKTKSDHVKKLTGFHFAKLVSLAKHFPAIAGGIIYYKDNLYSVSVGYRSVDSLKEKIKTCLSYDEYCAEWIHNTSMQIELTLNNQNNNEILNPNPYFSSLLMYLQSSEASKLLDDTLNLQGENNKFSQIYDFFKDIALECGYQKHFLINEIFQYFTLVDSSRVFNIDYDVVNIKIENQEFNVSAAAINKITINDKKRALEFRHHLVNLSLGHEGAIYFDESYKPNYEHVEFYKAKKEDYPFEMPGRKPVDFDNSISQFLRIFFTYEKYIFDQIGGLVESCSSEIDKLHKLKNYMNNKVHELIREPITALPVNQ